MTASARYGAFISYSHAASAEVARGLQKWLQTYAKPWWRWRAINVFRDETDLTAAPALWSRIANALDQSSHFILLASPNAAQSKWIKREIRYWLGDKHAGALDDLDLDLAMPDPNPERISTLLIALTAGDISWDEKAGNAGDFDWTKTNAVPRQLSGVFSEEPQWVDLRPIVQREELRTSLSRSNSEFMRAVAQLAAPIRGIADFSRLVSEDYRQYRRTVRTAWAAAAVLACVSAAALWQWRTAVVQRDRAVQAESAANKANAEAQANAKQARDNAQGAKANSEKAEANAEQAKANADKAEANAETAKANLREAQTRESRFLADQARQQRSVDPGTAVLLALEALPDAAAQIPRPYVPEAELQLDGASHDLQERLVLRHEDGVNSAAFSPDGKRIVTASSDNTTRIWEAASGKPIGEPLKGHADKVLSAAFSPDGKRIVTASSDRTARMWDVASGEPIGEPLRERGWVYSAIFSADGKRIVTATDDNTATIWNATTGKAIGEPLKGHKDWVRSAAFSPEGKRIVTASADKTARIWDAASGKPVGEPLRGHDDEVNSAAFSPYGKRIVTASSDNTTRIWDAATGKAIGEPLRGHGGPVRSAAFSPDGKRIVTASDDKTARIWDAANGKPIGGPLGGHDGGLNSAAFSPDGKRIVTASSDNTARIWDAETGKRTSQLLKGQEDVELSAAFSPDGK